MITSLESTLRNYAISWRYSNHNAPYTTIAQSSGSGKSRTVKELLESDNPSTALFFVCFRKPRSTCYPFRSYISDFFDREIIAIGAS